MEGQKLLFLTRAIVIVGIVLLFSSNLVFGKVTGPCANCHTMHNSQGGSPMATYGADGQPWKTTEPQPALLRGTCLGCHGMGGGSKIVTIGDSEIPQVYHTDTTDLAGGNFAYILGAKGGGASAAKGHNVIELGNNDDVLYNAPGVVHASPTNTDFTCAGKHGCHGTRYRDDVDGAPVSGLLALKGAHHRNVDGECISADESYNSYRFLKGVRGLENTNTADKWQNKDAYSHNEYFGTTTPGEYSCGGCHAGSLNEVIPDNHTISGFCATCHGHFHRVQGIYEGGDTSSPFVRHPTDVFLRSDGEYAAYTTYSVEAPVARTTVPGSMSNIVKPGTDVVMCLSCHAVHGSDYPDLLRWDYTTMIAGGGGGSGGCFTCHTQKN